jgi:hypothetical protein
MPRAPSRAARPLEQAGVDEQRLLQRVADLLARVERAIGVLEHDLHLVGRAPERGGPAGAHDFVAGELSDPEVGCSIMVTRRARVDLPQPDSPTTASVLPRQREARPVQGLQMRRLREGAARDR